MKSLFAFAVASYAVAIAALVLAFHVGRGDGVAEPRMVSQSASDARLSEPLTGPVRLPSVESEQGVAFLEEVMEGEALELSPEERAMRAARQARAERLLRRSADPQGEAELEVRSLALSKTGHWFSTESARTMTEESFLELTGLTPWQSQQLFDSALRGWDGLPQEMVWADVMGE